MHEDLFLETILRPHCTNAIKNDTSNNHGVYNALNLQDDCALLAPAPGEQIAISTDSVVEGVHFTTEQTPACIADRAINCALSDLAAMGAKPKAILMAMQISQQQNTKWIEQFTARVAYWQHHHHITLIGGDTVSGGILSINVTVLGSVSANKALYRSGAKAKMHLYTSGTIGNAAIALKLEQGHLDHHIFKNHQQEKDFLLEQLYTPKPQIELGCALTGYAQAAIDISDGLILDATRLAKASNVQLHIALDKLPLSSAVRRVLHHHPHWIETVLTGGDDYQLLFAAYPNMLKQNLDLQTDAHHFTAIGKVHTLQPHQEHVLIFDHAGKPYHPTNNGFLHAW